MHSNDDFLSAIRGLEDPLFEDPNPHKTIATEKVREAAARARDTEACKALGIHICHQCGGSGQFRGVRVHQPKAHCFACKGKGYFMRSYADRVKDRQKREQAKRSATDRIRSELNARSPEMDHWLAENAHWCDIARSVLELINKGKEPSERQLEAVISIRAKSDKTKAEKRAAREAEKAKTYVQVDLQPIRDMFEAAVAKGAKNPSYRAEGVRIVQAKAHSANAGMLYVTNEDQVYGGKLDGVTFKPTRDGQAHDFARVEPKGPDGKPTGEVILRTAAAALEAIAEDPLAAAIRHGHNTGYCACCGRLLVNDSKPDADGLTSVERGIGPICARKFGLM